MPHARIPEHALRLIWKLQHFSTSLLRTCDGRAVTVLFPGRPNTDSGPDFLEARIRIGNTLFTGDVELHCDASSWRGHGHDRDQRYNRVILHVVFTDDRLSAPATTASRRELPLLVLHPFLDPLTEAALLRLLLEDEYGRTSQIRCSAINQRVPANLLEMWLLHLAKERLELKTRRFRERLKQLVDEESGILRDPPCSYRDDPDDIPTPDFEYTRMNFGARDVWEQLLYEAVMESLGYEKNRDPFLALARAVPLQELRSHGINNTQSMMAILLGQGGLLPSIRGIRGRESRSYLLGLKRLWKSLYPNQRYPLIHSSRWMFFRLRPQNFPTARIAAFCLLLPLLFGENSFRTLVGIITDVRRPVSATLSDLQAIFRFEPDEFWSRNYHFRGMPGGKGITLGKGRIGDIVVNCFVPIVTLYAEIFGDSAVSGGVRRLAMEHPPLQENRIVRIIRRELLHGKVPVRSARLQQGAIQAYRAYCTQRRCGQCAVGRSLELKDDPGT